MEGVMLLQCHTGALTDGLTQSGPFHFSPGPRAVSYVSRTLTAVWQLQLMH